jgi:hypothetical protein
MGVISFSEEPEHMWYVPGWAFRQILDDIIQRYANDKELVERLELAKMYSGLILYRLAPSLADRIEAAIRDVVSGILAGIIPSGITEQPYGDQRTVQEYMESLEDLMRILQASKAN